MESLTEQDQLEVKVDDGQEEEGKKDEPIIDDSASGEFTRRPGKEPVIEEVTTKPLPTPFPQRLQKDKQETQSQQFLELFKQVKINLPLLEVFKQVPTYVKFIKDLCTFKRRTSVKKGVFLASQVSAIIRNELPPKLKDPGTRTISYIIGKKKISNAFLDLGSSVNLLPFTVY